MRRRRASGIPAACGLLFASITCLCLAAAPMGGAALADAGDDLRAGIRAQAAGRYDRAIEHFTLAIESESLSQSLLASTYYRRGTAYAEQRAWPQAIADFDRSLELNPESAPAYSDRARAHFSTGALEQAEMDIESALARRDEAQRVWSAYLILVE